MEQLQHDQARQPAAPADERRDAAVGRRPRTSVNFIAARVVAVALVIATGAIHLYLYQDGYSSVPTMGPLFLANFVAAVVLGLAVLVRRQGIWGLLGAGFCLGTLVAFLVSVHWGLFGYQETLSGAWQGRAAAVEIAGTLACLIVAAWARRGMRGPKID